MTAQGETDPERRDLSAMVCVVGSGPAGTAVVETLTAAGVEVIWCHEGPVRRPLEVDSEETLLRLSGAVVWDAAPGRIRYHNPADSTHGAVAAPFLVFATGATDRHLAFPHWTAASVRGACDVLQDVRHGGEAPPGPIRLVGLSWHMQAVGEALARHGVESGQLLGDGAFPPPVPMEGTGTLVTCFGMIPAVELPALAGAELEALPAAGGWLPRRMGGLPVVELRDDAYAEGHDRPQVSHRPTHPVHPDGSILVAGAAGGIGDREAAVADGQLAGQWILEQLGGKPVSGALLRRVGRGQWHAQRASRKEELTAAWRSAAAPDTVVCPCEEVTRAQVEQAFAEHGDSYRAARLGSRAGMGICQGRVCTPLIHDLLLAHDVAGPLPPSVRAPVRPVPAVCLADLPSGSEGNEGAGESNT